MTSASARLPVLNGCASLQLSRGLNALIDACDFPELSRSTWFVTQTRRGGRLYAATDALADGRPGRVSLHRHLIGDPPGVLTDHVNQDSLDNRRRNLRPASTSQNTANGPKSCRGGRSSSRFKGVSRYRFDGRWQAGVCRDRHRYYLGLYLTETEAATAYNHAARLLFGDFARLNRFEPGEDLSEARRIAVERDVGRRLARIGIPLDDGLLRLRSAGLRPAAPPLRRSSLRRPASLQP
jgi:hypothetical protein